MSRYYNDRRFAEGGRHRGPGGLVVFMLLFAAFSSAIGASLLLSNDHTRLKLLLLRLGFQQSSVANLSVPFVNAQSAAQASMGVSVVFAKKARLLKGRAPIRADEQCATLAALAEVEPVFTREDGGAKWECSYLVMGADLGRQSSIFVQIRGREAVGNATFRLKISFGTLSEREALAYQASAIAARLLDLDAYLSISLGDALARGQDFRREIAAATISYKREMLDESRYNLVGTYPLPKAPAQQVTN